MLKALFRKPASSRMQYIPFEGRLPAPLEIPPPPEITLILRDRPDGRAPLLIKTGDPVKTGQKLTLYQDSSAFAVSPVTGTITAVSPYCGEMGEVGCTVTIETCPTEETDDAFAGVVSQPSLESAAAFLTTLPGSPCFKAFSNPEKTIHTLVINGADPDLLVATRQFVVQTRMEALTQGIAVLKKITGVENVVLIVPATLMGGYGSIGAEMKFVEPLYPSALPPLILKDVFGRVLPAGKSPEDIGFVFFSAEGVAAIGQAFSGGTLPVHKLLTVIKKDGSKHLVSTRIGTPLREVLNIVGETIEDGDRVIVGGPMMGSSIFTLDHPVRPGTDALMVQDRESIAFVSDYPCINCGECIRACPARIQVNMLVRFLEAGQYLEALDRYDLDACIECGLCSYVCVAHIPIFQYIRLAKYELARANAAEVMNV